MSLPQNISRFPVEDADDCIEVRFLGHLSYRGMTLKVEIEAFSDTEQGERLKDYDYHTAALHVVKIPPAPDMDFHTTAEGRDEFLSALQAFMVLTLEGPSNVSWGESGAQSPDTYAFGRNGW